MSRGRRLLLIASVTGTVVVIGAVAGAWVPVSHLWSAGAARVTIPPTTITPPPRRVLLVGDSMAFTLGFGLHRDRSDYGLYIDNQGTFGCGIVQGGPYNQEGISYPQSPPCDSWPQRWTALLQGPRPDVAAILTGRWELMDRMHNGTLQHIGQPAFDDYLLGELETAVGMFTVRNIPVVLLSSPYFLQASQPKNKLWPEDDPARVDRWNALLSVIAARHPGRVQVAPLGAWLSPDGRYAQVVGGAVVRDDDGIHFTDAAGVEVAPQLLPVLRQAAA